MSPTVTPRKCQERDVSWSKRKRRETDNTREELASQGMTATVCCRTAASTTFAQSVLAAIGGWLARVALGRMKRESEHGDTRD